MASAVLKDGGSLGILVCGLVAVRQPGLAVTGSMRKVHVWLGFKKKKKKKVCVKVTQSCSTLCDPCQDPLSMEFSRPEYWSG